MKCTNANLYLLKGFSRTSEKKGVEHVLNSNSVPDFQILGPPMDRQNGRVFKIATKEPLNMPFLASSSGDVQVLPWSRAPPPKASSKTPHLGGMGNVPAPGTASNSRGYRLSVTL